MQKFFLANIVQWNYLDVNTGNSISCNVFKSSTLTFIRPEPNQVFDVCSTEILKLLTRMCLGLSHLADHKFRHKFQDCLEHKWICGQDIETTIHFLLHCPSFHCERQFFFEKLAKDLIFCSKKLESEKNKSLLYCLSLIL